MGSGVFFVNQFAETCGKPLEAHVSVTRVSTFEWQVQVVWLEPALQIPEVQPLDDNC